MLFLGVQSRHAKLGWCESICTSLLTGHLFLWPVCFFIRNFFNICTYLYIRRPRPLPRQGRRLGPPEVWNLALWSQAKAHAFPRQQLCQLHAPAIYLPQPSSCPCHLFFRGFKTAVCPPSNPPNPSAGLQGNNSYSYIPLPSAFQGVQDCRLPGLKPSKPPRRPPRQQLLQLRAPAICFSGGSRLPFARPQTLQTPPQASKATTLTATCPCHLFFRGFKTAVCPPSNPPNPSAGLQGNNSYSYMPLPSVFQGVQDCRLPGLKPSKPFRRPPRQQLLQLHASKATTLTATCPCHLFFRGFKTAVCPPSNPPNPSAGLHGNNSYSYMPLPSAFQGVQDCRLPGLKPSKPLRRPPRQQLLQLHAPAICFSGGSRLPFARPQTLQTPPQASKATTLTATCPCHLLFRGFKTAVCPASNPPNPSAGLQGNNSYSYMPLPSVFQGVQDCCLPGLKPSKPLRRPPRQQLLQLHAPAICFSGNPRPQALQTPPQASKATTLTATCPCHLFFRGFKTAAVCPASNPLQGVQDPSAGLQGNNSYSYMPLPSAFQGVQDCRLPALKPSKPLRRPPRQQLLQLHAPAICFSGGSRLPFARPQTLQTPPQASKATTLTTLTATCPCHLFFRGFQTAVARPQTLQTLPQASKAGLQGNNSYSYMPLPSVFQGVQDCRLPGLKPSKPLRRPPRQQLLPSSYMPLPSAFQGVQDYRLPGLKPSKPLRRPPRQQLLQLHAPAICFSGGSRLLFARPQTLQTLRRPPRQAPAIQGNNSYSYMPLPSVFQGVQDCRLPGLKPSNPSAGLQGNNSYSYMPLPSAFQGVQDCRLPALKPSKPLRRPPRQQLLQLHAPAICREPPASKPLRRPPRQQLLQLHAPAICFSGGSRLPFARPQTLQTPPQASKATTLTTLTATCPCHLFFRGFQTAVARPQTLQTLPQASKATTLTATCLQGNNSYSYMPLPSAFQGVQDCRLPALEPSKPLRRPPSNNSYSYMPLPSVFQGTPGLKPSKPLRRPPRQQLLQLHAPAICFSGGSRLPFARPQTLQTPPQASKATTLTATCPCHLLFRGFKTAVCPASNPPNPSAGLQGNNSYSYMPLPSAFPGGQDCRLPALKPSKPLRRPPRQQLLQLHAPAICFSGSLEPSISFVLFFL